MNDRQQEKIDVDYRNRLRAIQPVDEMVGDVVRDLRESGKLDNTYIVFTSDNGYKHGQHRLAGKWTSYEEDIRVPLFIRGPRVPEGRRLSKTVLNIDLAPTFVELGGASMDKADGRSLVPLLDSDPPRDWRKRFLIENFRSEFPKGTMSNVPTYQGVRTENMMYVEHSVGRKVTDRELYGLHEDPYQLTSRHRTKNRDLVRKLDGQLSRLARCQGEECRAAEGG